jgi:hypothetical protein
MRIRAFLSIVIFGLWPSFVLAADVSHFTLKKTEDLYQICSTKPGNPLHNEAINFCQGFLLGVVSYHDAVTDRQNLQRLICYPATVTRDDGIMAFLEWSANNKTNEKLMTDPPVIGMVRGLAHKWPCKQG